MKAKQIVMLSSVMMGLALALGLLVGLASADGPTVQETNLTPGGSVYEVNLDASGNLWLSEYNADQVWHLNPATGVYTIYQNLNAASDARMDASGDVWWNDYDNGNLGRISLGAGTVTTWALPGAGCPWGLAFDSAGQVWVTDDCAPNIYRFNPTTTQVCSYTVPDNGRSVYIKWHAGDLWLGDQLNARILRLDPATNQFTQWQLPAVNPGGLAVDGSGNLWWADLSLEALARLEPTVNRVTTYTVPIGGGPRMIALSGESVWYTEFYSGTFGLLDPAVAGGVSTTVVVTPAVAVAPLCSILGPGISSTVPISTGVVSWTPAVVTPTVNSGGWTVYELPSGSLPWGIAVDRGNVWIADLGRDKLIGFSYSYPVHLPIILKNYSP